MQTYRPRFLWRTLRAALNVALTLAVAFGLSAVFLLYFLDKP